MNYDPGEFVDREPQLQDFRALLGTGTTKRVLLFHGPPGIGKTWLALRLCAECRSAGVQFALVNFELSDEYKRYKIEDLVTSLQRQLGGEFSARIGARILELEREFARPSPLEQVFTGQPWGGGLALHASAGSIRADIGDVGPDAMVAVGQGNFQNCQFYVNPLNEPELIQQQKRLGLDRIVQEELAGLLARQPVALLFDSCDTAPREVLDWLQRQLIEPLIQGQLAYRDRLSLIVTGALEGRRGPWVGDLAGWASGVIADKLGNLLPVDVQHWWVDIHALGAQTIPLPFLQVGSAPKLMFEMAQLTAQMEVGHGG